MPSEQALASLSNSLVYAALGIYVLAMLSYAAAAAVAPVRMQRRATAVALATVIAGAPSSGPASLDEPTSSQRAGFGWRTGTSLTVLATALHALGVLMRGLASGRAPWGNMYEFALVGALVASIAYLVLLRIQRRSAEDLRVALSLGVWVVGLVALTLGLAITVLYVPAGPLIPVLNSYWLVIHVAAAITCAGVFTVGAVCHLLYLLQVRSGRRAESGTGRGRRTTLPSAETLERIAYKVHVFAFPLWTFAVIAGAIWAENAWGRYWGWDPKETWAFITWVMYAAYLHAAATPSWRGARGAVLGLLGYAALLFNFIGVNMWISGLHSYAGV